MSVKGPRLLFSLHAKVKVLREHFAPTNDQILDPQVIDFVPRALFLLFAMQSAQQWHSTKRRHIRSPPHPDMLLPLKNHICPHSRHWCLFCICLVSLLCSVQVLVVTQAAGKRSVWNPEWATASQHLCLPHLPECSANDQCHPRKLRQGDSSSAPQRLGPSPLPGCAHFKTLRV